MHAHNHLRELGGIKTTRENLEEAVNGEIYEFKQMYPGMIEDAKAEGNKGAERTFTYANEVEKVHAALYKKAMDGWARASRPIITSARFAVTRQRAGAGQVPGVRRGQIGLQKSRLKNVGGGVLSAAGCPRTGRLIARGSCAAPCSPGGRFR